MGIFENRGLDRPARLTDFCRAINGADVDQAHEMGKVELAQYLYFLFTRRQTDLVDPGEKIGRKEGFHIAVVEVFDTERARRGGVEIRQGRRADDFVTPV